MNTSITSKEKILIVCKSIAIKDGLQALNMRSVAKECGVAVGSIYNYFPSKADIMSATIEDVWKSIFNFADSCNNIDNFIVFLEYLFNTVNTGINQYPMFLTIHSISFTNSDKEKGKFIMNQYFDDMKNELLKALQNDKCVKATAFDDNFTKENFVDFIFSNLITLFVRKEKSCNVLIEIAKRSIY